MNLQQMYDTIKSTSHVYIRTVLGTFLNLWQEDLRQSWKRKGIQPGTSNMGLMLLLTFKQDLKYIKKKSGFGSETSDGIP